MSKYGCEGRGAAQIAKAPYLITEGSDQVWPETAWKPPDCQSAILYHPPEAAGVIQYGGAPRPPLDSTTLRLRSGQVTRTSRGIGRLTWGAETHRLARVGVVQAPLSPLGGKRWPCLERWARSRSWTWQRGR